MDLAGLYRDIVESSSDGIWVIDLEGRTTYSNPQMATMLRVEHDEVVAMSLFDVLDDIGKDQLASHLQELQAGRVNRDEVECRLARPDGTTMWVLVRESALWSEHERINGVLLRITDYSARRETLEALRTSRERLSETQRIARIGSWSWDVIDDRLSASTELLEIYGLKAHRFPAPSEQFFASVHPDDRETVAQAIEHVRDGGCDLGFDARLRGDSGWIWTRARGVAHRDEAGGLLAITGTHQDISETKRSERVLFETLSQHRLLQSMAVAANEASTLHEVLARARKLVLLHDDLLRGRAFVPVGDAQHVVPFYVTDSDLVEDLADSTRAATELDVAGRAYRSGGPVWDAARVTVACPVSFQGEVHAVVTTTTAPHLHHHDDVVESLVGLVAVQLARVAERERVEQVLADARDAAMEASRQKSEFLATMSHEIRTPLNGVIGLNELLLGSALSIQQQRLASGVQIASRALLGVINDILDFSKIEAGQLQLEELDFEVRPVLDQVASVLAQTARAKGVELLISCHPDVPEVVSGDPTRLSQVLTNLVSNAVKFTDRGEVLVRAAVRAADEAGLELGVDIIDTGIGIEAIHLPGLFAPFTQADASTTRVYGGTGLGLAISKEIVEALGGTLHYEPNPAGGSIFSFSVRVRPPTSSTIDPADETARSLLAGRRVLVVDDTEHSRWTLEEQLDWWDLRPVCVEGADEAVTALARAQAEGDDFDAVILDLATPLRDGMYLAREIRADPTYDDLVLLMLTSTPGLDPGVMSQEHISDLLDKPVPASTLRESLVRLLGGHRPDFSGPPSLTRPPTPRRVLIVEDNLVNQMVATGMLESMGYQVAVADDGKNALGMLEEIEFDAVLMDVQMPRMDGYQTTRAIRASHGPNRRTPVVAMTAAAIEGERERCLEAGMDDFLTKPVDLSALSSVLDDWITTSKPEPECPADDLAKNPRREDDAPPGTEDLDVARLDMLRDLDPGNTTYLDRAIGNFLVNSAAAVAEMREAIAGRDPERLRQVSHKLVGSALNLGVIESGESVRRIEHLADTGSVEGALGMLAPVEQSLERGRRALLVYQASYRVSSG